MAIITHGSDLSLAPTIRPIVRQIGGGIREALDRLAKGGFNSVQLDATLAGIRPRDLDARARKDLSAVLMRESFRPAGIDLFIPRRHFTEPENVDRAMSATIAAIELAADLGRLPLSLSLPVKDLGEDSRKALVEAADGRGIRLAVHAEDQLDALLAWMDSLDLYALGAGLDPAAVLARDGDPASLVHKLGKRLVSARLNDLGQTNSQAESEMNDDDVRGAGVRSIVGEGDLDLTSYRVAVDMAPTRSGPVVLDLRGMENPLAGAFGAKAAWDQAAFKV